MFGNKQRLIAALENRDAKRANQVAATQNYIATLEDAVAKKDAHIAALQNQISASEDLIAALKRVIADQEAVLGSVGHDPRSSSVPATPPPIQPPALPKT
jgi:peptidoglycan hydrolase CwlO-like protein